MSLEKVRSMAAGIAARRDLPNRSRFELREQLSFVFGDAEFPDQTRQQQFRLRRAQDKYLEVLYHRPHLFLAVLLALPKRSCATFDIENLFQQSQTYPIEYLPTAKATILDIAEELGLSADTRFSSWMNIVFAGAIAFEYPDSARSSVTNIWSNRVYSLIPTIASSEEAASCSPVHIRLFENEDDMTIRTRIRFDEDLITELFPTVYTELLSLTPDKGRVRLSPASTRAVEENIKPKVREFFHKSRLREWEVKGNIVDMTSCLVLEVDSADKDTVVLDLKLARNLYLIKEIHRYLH